MIGAAKIRIAHCFVDDWITVVRKGLRGKRSVIAETTTKTGTTAKREIPVFRYSYRFITGHLESRVQAYHLEHHREDEAAAGVSGLVEFTRYTVSAPEARSGEAFAQIEVAGQKSLLAKGVAYFGLFPGRSISWQERWLLTKDGWVFAERLTNPVGMLLID